jgi:protein arginine kinase activator
MVCNICGQSDATIHLTEIINSQMVEIHLCESCAEQKGTDFKTHFDFNKLLASLTDLGAVIKTETGGPLACRSCGMNYEEFGTTGRLGCPQCYETFEPVLMPLIKRVQKGTRHFGKTPGKTRGDIRFTAKLRELQAKLSKAIDLESFEEAAITRDQIKKLEDKIKSGRKKTE